MFVQPKLPLQSAVEYLQSRRNIRHQESLEWAKPRREGVKVLKRDQHYPMAEPWEGKPVLDV